MSQKPRLFISHSSKDNVAAETLKAALDPHFSVFLDKVDLRPGDSWQESIETELLGCHCAVVMLSPNVIANPHWVQAEAYVFSLRLRLLDSEFRMVPVLLDGVTEDDLNTAQLAKAKLASIQALKMTTGSIDATPVLDGLAPVLQQFQALQPLRAVAISLAEVIDKQLGINAQELIAECLEIELSDLQRAKARSRWLAASLLRCTRAQLEKVHKALTPAAPDAAKQIFRKVAPYTWVDPGAATMIASAAVESPKPPLAMNATRVETPRIYVRRASPGPGEWTPVDSDGDFAKDDGVERTVDDMIIDNVRRALARSLGFDSNSEPSIADVNMELETAKPGEPVFVLLPPWVETMGPDLLQRIAPTFPAVVYLLWTNQPLTTSGQKLPPRLKCLPVLTAAHEQSVYRMYDRCIPKGEPLL